MYTLRVSVIRDFFLPSFRVYNFVIKNRGINE